MVCFFRDNRTDERVFNAKIAPSADIAILAGTGGFGLFNVDREKLSTIDRAVFPRCIAVSRNSQYIALGLWSRNNCDMTADADIQVRRVDTGGIVLDFNAHKASVNSVAFSPDSALLASCGEDGFLKIWDLNTGQPIVDRKVHDNGIGSVAYSPDGKVVSVGAVDQENRKNIIKLINTTTGKTVSEIVNPEYCFIQSLSFNPSGKKLAAVLSVSVIKVWDISKPETPRLILSCDDNRCISNGTIWEPDRKSEYLHNDGGRIEAVTFSPDDASFAAFGFGGIFLYSGFPGSAVVGMRGQKGGVLDAVFGKNGVHIITVGKDELLRFIDLKTKDEIRKARGLTLRVQWHWRLLFLLSFAWLIFYAGYMASNNTWANQQKHADRLSRRLLSCVAAFYFTVLLLMHSGSAIQNLPEIAMQFFLSLLIGLYIISIVLMLATFRFFKQHWGVLLSSTLIIFSFTFLAIYSFMEALAAV